MKVASWQYLGGVFKRNPQLSIKPIWTEDNIKEMKRERKIPPAQDWGLYKRTEN